MGTDATKLQPLSILIVDDEEFILETMAHFLKRRAKEVVMASNGAEAWKLLQERTFDIVVSDIEMPEMNGYELYHAVHPEHPEIPFVFLSGHTKGDVKEEFKPYTLFKPIDKDNLIDKISSFF